MDIAKFRESCRSAALGEYAWSEVLRDTCALIGADKAVISSSDLTRPDNISVAYQLQPSIVEAYNRKYYASDPRLASLKRLKPGETMTGQQSMPNNMMKGTDYYDNILLKSDIGGSLHSVILDTQTTGRQSIVLFRGFSDKAFGQTEVDKMQALLPSLAEAMCYALKIAMWQEKKNAHQVFSALLDEGLRLYQLTGEMRSVFASYDNVISGGEYLLPETEVLRGIFTNAVKLSGQGRTTQFRLNSDEHNSKFANDFLQIMISPRPKSIDWIAPIGESALLRVARVSTDRCFNLDMFSNVFGLTNAEARALKALATNSGTREAAFSAGISYKTLRWHLKNIFCKTGCNNQEGLLNALFDMDISNAAL